MRRRGEFSTDDFAGTDVGGVAVLAEAASLQGATGVPLATNGVELVRLGSYAAAGGNAEVVSFDPTTDQLYILNTTGNKIEIVQIAATGVLTKTGEIDLASLTEFGGANSVAVKNGIVAVAYGNSTAGDNGHVALFNAAGALQGAPIEVGVLPDMLTFTPDGSKILVANEAEAVSTGATPTARSASSTSPAGLPPPPSRAPSASPRSTAARLRSMGPLVFRCSRGRALRPTSSRNTSRYRPTGRAPMSRCRRSTRSR